MKKRIGAFLMAGAMACTMTASLAMSGCDNGEGNGKQAADFVMPPEIVENGLSFDEQIEITFSHTMGSNLKDVLDEYIGEFNKLYPNIKVTTTAVGGYDDVRDDISTKITVGNQPNIAYCYPDHVALYNSAGAVQTLDTLIASDVTVKHADGTTEIVGLTQAQKDDFIEGYYEEGLAYGDGKMYTMPFSKSTEVLYYNKTFFDKHQLKVPETWDELGETCAKILEITGGKKVEVVDGKEVETKIIPLGYDSEANWFITMCEQYGSPYTSATGDHFLFDNAKNREFVTKFKQWFDAGYFTTQAINTTYTSNIFKVETSFMSIGSSAGAVHQRPTAIENDDGTTTYPFEVGIATIPQVDKNNPKVISQGPSVCIFKKNNPKEVLASWLFVKYLTTSVEFQAKFSLASGYVPVLKSVAENPTYKAYLDKANGGSNISSLAAKVCMQQEKAYYTSPAFIGSSKARDEVGKLLQAVFTGSKTLQKAFEEAIDECEYFAG